MRERLPNRRPAYGFEYSYGRLVFIAHEGPFPRDGAWDGIAELFVTCKKTGTEIDTTVRATSTMLSLALQAGVPFETCRLALPRDSSGNAMEPVGAAMDLIAKDNSEVAA
jgi:hypothetical protein